MNTYKFHGGTAIAIYRNILYSEDICSLVIIFVDDNISIIVIDTAIRVGLLFRGSWREKLDIALELV